MSIKVPRKDTHGEFQLMELNTKFSVLPLQCQEREEFIIMEISSTKDKSIFT
jgi:hypothetical protein